MKILKRITFYFQDFSLYKLVALLGFLIRIIFLPKIIPNAFELISNTALSSWHMPSWLYETVLRIILLFVDGLGLNRIFYHLAYQTTGCFYRRGSNPIMGSVMYTLYYVIYTLIPVCLINCFTVAMIAVVLSFLALSYIGFSVTTNLDGMAPDNWVFKQIILTISFIAFTLAISLIKSFVA